MIQRFLFPALLAVSLLFTSCESPLDTDTPRNVIPVTPAVKVTPVSVRPTFNGAYGSYVFNGTPVFQVDTTTTPMTVWMDLDLLQVPDTSAPSARPKATLQRFGLKVDSVLASGYNNTIRDARGRMWIDVGASSIDMFAPDSACNTMNLLISEVPSLIPGKRKLTISIYMVTNKDGSLRQYQTGLDLRQEQVLGSIDLEI